jgi:hypothetical protein
MCVVSYYYLTISDGYTVQTETSNGKYTSCLLPSPSCLVTLHLNTDSALYHILVTSELEDDFV